MFTTANNLINALENYHFGFKNCLNVSKLFMKLCDSPYPSKKRHVIPENGRAKTAPGFFAMFFDGSRFFFNRCFFKLKGCVYLISAWN